MRKIFKLLLGLSLIYSPFIFADELISNQNIMLNKACDEQRIIKAHLGNQEIHLALACTESQQEYGLMFRKTLSDNDGMIFVFKENQMLHFWMKDTLIPLSIAYLDDKFTIKEIYNMKAEDLTVTASKEPLKYAVEVNLDWFKKHNVKIGEKLLIDTEQ
jgi:uncharacterized protein